MSTELKTRLARAEARRQAYLEDLQAAARLFAAEECDTNTTILEQAALRYVNAYHQASRCRKHLSEWRTK